MANPEHVEILRQGIGVWGDWRKEHPAVVPDLSNVDLIGANLSEGNFSGADFSNTDLVEANLIGADCSGANFTRANLVVATLARATLRRAIFKDADLIASDLTNATLSGAKLNGARLGAVNLANADLTNVDLTGAHLATTIFANNDLSNVIGLDRVIHNAPSTIGLDTLFNSRGAVPEIFLRGCGVPDTIITQILPRISNLEPIQFYSCFISYSGKDEEFARCLRSRMLEAGLRIWFAPEDIKAGDKIYDQIDRAIQLHDRLLLVLSESSLSSKWVETEIRRARKVELREGRRKLFPIRLMSYQLLQQWECFDSTTGEDLAEEVRSYFIPDFSNWKSHNDFERAFARLYEDLRASA